MSRITFDAKKVVRAVTRREVLNFAWIIPLGVGLLETLRFLRFEPPANQLNVFTLGSPSSITAFPAYFEGGQVWIQSDGEGYYAVDAVCTHLGCTINTDGKEGYACPCHGSRFAADGTVRVGPATRPLRFLKLSWTDSGELMVDRSKEVADTFRLAVV